MHRHVHILSLAVATLAVLAHVSTASAQVTLSGQVELARLIDVSAQRLGMRVTYDESQLRSRVTLRQDQPLSDRDIWAMTNRLLAEQGLTTVWAADDETVAVVKLASAAQVARIETLDVVSRSLDAGAVALTPDKVHDAAQKTPASPGFRRVMIPLQRASGKDVAAAIQPVLSKPGGIVVESEQAGFIILADLAAHLRVGLTIVNQLDGQEGGLGGAVVKPIPARNIDAARVATLAKQLVERRKAVGGREIRGDIIASAGGEVVLLIAPPAFVQSWEDVLAAVDQREPMDRRTYPITAFGLKEVSSLIEQTVRTHAGGTGLTFTDDRWRLIADDLTGTLIITATPSQHEQIKELLDRLNETPLEARRPVRSFKVRHRAVSEVVRVIEDLVRAGVLDSAPAAVDASGLSPVQATQVTLRPFAPGGGSSSSADATAPGALLRSETGQTPSSANANAVSSASRRGGRGDSQPLTLTADEATSTIIAVGEPRLLAQREQLIPTLDVRQPQVMLEALLVSLSDSQTLDFGAELERLRLSGDIALRLSSLFGLSTAGTSGGERTRTVGDGAGFTGVVLDPGDFSVVVRALETVNKGRTLSHPKVLVNNNQQASFSSTLEQPFASTNASNTVATTSFGGSQSAGTTISVKPQIAEGDHLVLTYSVSLSSFVGAAASANVPPPRQQNSVQSIATIPDGYTVVVGGLELTNSGDGRSQVPIVGDIPLIGELFKNQSKTGGRQRFYVFLRATVLRSTNLEDLKYLSDLDAGAAAVPSEWPVVEPRVIR